MSAVTRCALRVVAALPLLALAPPAWAEAPTPDTLKQAMRKATRFLVDRLAYRGGYVWAVSEDFEHRYGEIPARPSQIWVQQGTPMVGMVLLDAYEATGDREYLDAGRKAADALIYGQHPLGGWHYFVDFDPPGVPAWYEREASRYKWGYEEYRHYYGNCTFDDRTTSGAAAFLLRLYLLTLDPAYRGPLVKAVDFVLLAQYPNGAWPQRFPLRDEFAHDGLPDYTPYYTLNDGAAAGNIELLVAAYEGLGDERYLAAARKAMDFVMAVQGPEGQAAWAEQYGPDMKPVAARTHEPAGYVLRESAEVVMLLGRFYQMTGDRRYIGPIPACLDWFDRVRRESSAQNLPLARYYEPGSNRPIHVIRTDKTNAQGYGLYRWTPDPTGLSDPARPPVDGSWLRREYARLAALSPEAARAEYAPHVGRRHIGPRRRPSSVDEVLRAMDGRGAWLEDRVMVLTISASGLNPGSHEPMRGYSTRTFVNNLGVLIDALAISDDGSSARGPDPIHRP